MTVFFNKHIVVVGILTKEITLDYIEIKKQRELVGMTQVEVARGVGVSLAGYRNWEIGAGKPTPENLKKLKKVLGV